MFYKKKNSAMVMAFFIFFVYYFFFQDYSTIIIRQQQLFNAIGQFVYFIANYLISVIKQNASIIVLKLVSIPL